MRQSQTYRRKKYGEMVVDPDKYETYRQGVAYRILRKRRGRISPHEAWQLAAVPAFFLWVFRGPIRFFKKKRIDRAIRRKIAGSNNK